MKSSQRINIPCGGTNIVELISSVNTLIDNLSGSAVDVTDPAMKIDRSAVDIDRQLQQLEQLFAQSTQQQKVSKQSHHRSAGQQEPMPDAGAACSRSPCSNCTVSNCNAAAGTSWRSVGADRQYQSASITSSSDSGKCCIPIVSSSCCHTKLLEEAAGVASQCLEVSSKNPNPTSSDSLENASNRRRLALRMRRRPLSLKDKGGDDGGRERMDFGFLKRGLVDNARQEKSQGCVEGVLYIEGMVQRLQRQVAQLRRRCESQARPECGVPKWLASDVLRLQSRVSSLQGQLRQTLGGRGSAGKGCRHRGSATEQARDLVTDIKCKYETSLLFNRFDANWPYMHIIAPRPPTWNDPVCCEEQ